MQERGKRVEGVSLGEYQMQMCDSKVVEYYRSTRLVAGEVLLES